MLVTPFLRPLTVAIGGSTHVLHVDVALLMQLAEDLAEAVESFADVLCLLVLGVGFVGDLDVEVEARQLVFGE